MPARALTLELGPVPVGHYRLTGQRDVVGNPVYLLLERRMKHASDTLQYTVDPGSVQTIQTGLCSERLRANLGRYGKIDLTFTPTASGRAGCRGLADLPFGASRRATATGRLRLVTHTRYFGTITFHRLAARFVNPEPRSLQGVQGTVAHGTFLDDAGGLFSAWLPRRGPVQEEFGLSRQVGPVGIDAQIQEWALPRAFFTADQAKSARVRWGGPWLSGSTTFLASRLHAHAGRLIGRLTVRSGSTGVHDIIKPGHPFPAILSIH